jgi:hypothetical protein
MSKTSQEKLCVCKTGGSQRILDDGYARAAQQFGAFHIRLESTHRYLVAYRMVEETADKSGILGK